MSRSADKRRGNLVFSCALNSETRPLKIEKEEEKREIRHIERVRGPGLNFQRRVFFFF